MSGLWNTQSRYYSSCSTGWGSWWLCHIRSNVSTICTEACALSGRLTVSQSVVLKVLGWIIHPQSRPYVFVGRMPRSFSSSDRCWFSPAGFCTFPELFNYGRNIKQFRWRWPFSCCFCRAKVPKMKTILMLSFYISNKKGVTGRKLHSLACNTI